MTDAAPRSRRRPRDGAGKRRVLKGSWVTYLLVAVVTLVSVFPLYYTIVMASHTNAEMAAGDSAVAAEHVDLRQHEEGAGAGAAQPRA